MLIEAAHRLVRFNPEWKAMSARLQAKGKKKCVVIAAVANRWVRRLFYQLTHPESASDPACDGMTVYYFPAKV